VIGTQREKQREKEREMEGESYGEKDREREKEVERREEREREGERDTVGGILKLIQMLSQISILIVPDAALTRVPQHLV